MNDQITFRSQVIAASNDPDEMEKAIKYNRQACRFAGAARLSQKIYKMKPAKKSAVPAKPH